MAKPDSETHISPRLIGGVILGALILLFIAENGRRTRMRFLLPEVTAPLWTALFVAVLLGGLAGALLTRHFSGPKAEQRKKGRSEDKPK
jgi:uncharacterized integral membrane protein